MRRYAAAFGFAALTGCAQVPVVQTEVVHVPQYIPIPSELLKDCVIQLSDDATWGQALNAYNAALKRCQGEISAIRTLAPPISTKPINP